MQGKFTGSFAPYGYKKSPDDRHKLIIDSDTAPIVQRMFAMKAEGKTFFAIARTFKNERIPSPRMRQYEMQKVKSTVWDISFPYAWEEISVRRILENPVYLGHMVSQRATSKSYKNRKLVHKPKEEWVEVKNTHEAIVDEELFNLVGREIGVKRPQKKSAHENIFAGKLKCADCGKGLHLKPYDENTAHFSCGSYKRHGREICSCHHIGYVDVYKAVLNSIKDKAAEACGDEKFFLDKLKNSSNQKAFQEKRQLEKSIAKAEKRISEINAVIKRLYEDSVLGNLTQERFSSLNNDYDLEQDSLRRQLFENRKQLAAVQEKDDGIAKFTGLIEKYKNLQELNVAVVIELVDKILVHEREHIAGKHTQRLDIYFNFIGLT